jgi:hypothetical protein
LHQFIVNKSGSKTENAGLFDPIADASRLVRFNIFIYIVYIRLFLIQGMAYSESKRQSLKSKDSETKIINDETTPLEMVRFAMIQLESFSKNELFDDQHTLPNVQSMLQVTFNFKIIKNYSQKDFFLILFRA